MNPADAQAGGLLCKHSSTTPARRGAGRFAPPAAVAIWSGWVGLGQLCGFGLVHPLPGIVPGFEINTAITLPVGVEAYASFALGAWLSTGVPDGVRSFTKRSALGALSLGMLGQVAYHLLSAAHATHAPWPVTVLVACLPVTVLGFGIALAHLLREGCATAPADEAGQPVAVGLLTAGARPPLRLAWPAPAAPAAPRSRRARSASGKRRRGATVTDEQAALWYRNRRGRIPSMRKVRSDMRVGQARAQAIVAHLTALADGSAA